MDRVKVSEALEIRAVQGKKVEHFVDLHDRCEVSVVNLNAADLMLSQEMTPDEIRSTVFDENRHSALDGVDVFFGL